MTSNDDMDRRLAAWLDEEAAPRAPVALTEAFTDGVGKKRQRPGWATTEGWISMETRAQFGAVPRAIIVLATLALLTALAAGAIAIGASNGPKLPDPFGAAGNGLIAFVSDGDIYVVEPEGSGLKPITSGPGVEDIPVWSRDGTRLAYWSGPEEGFGNLVVVDADGSDAVTVAETSRPFSVVVWSPDGTEIMYDAIVPELIPDTCPNDEDDDYACGARLFIAAADGSGSRQVGDPNLTARGAVLSPDGWTVAFGGGGETASEALYLMDWDGSNVERLDTGIAGGSVWPFSGQSWSPDGTRIATHDGNGTIWLVELDETGAFQATERLGTGYFPTYAPASGEILWDSGWIYTPDGQGGFAPTTSSFEGDWSPDATKLVGVIGDDLVVTDRDSGDRTAISVVVPTTRLSGMLLWDESVPSWQRVAP